MGFFKKDTAVLNKTDKKIRAVVVLGCIFVLFVLFILNVFLDMGKSIRPVIFFSNGKNIIYSIKNNSVIDDTYVSFYSGFIDFNKTSARELKAHFDSETY